MNVHGRTSIHEFLGDFVVYRNLTPLDERLPGLDDVREQTRIPHDVIPRKSEPPYAHVIVELLRAARESDAPKAKLRRLIYVGDTRMNDGNAFRNIAGAGEWPGMAFIAAEKGDATPPDIIEVTKGPGPPRTLYLASRWGAISDFEDACRDKDFAIDEHTAIVVDLDKTALGARGRNDHVINQARMEAVRRTVGELLGGNFDREAFETAYDVLNQSEFHPFTSDNQDYLAYICLILGSGLYQLQPLTEEVREARMRSFRQFIDRVDERASDLPVSLRGIHQRIYDRVQAGDPTPFKMFRYNEYHATVERMGWKDDRASAAELLGGEIVITQEVREAALHWKAKGALLFGLSDKPDEASIPTEDLANEGYQPIHRVETHAVGAE